MLDIEQISTNTTAYRGRVVIATPESLRELANRLEQQALDAQTMEVIECELTPSIRVVYKPEKPVYYPVSNYIPVSSD